MSRKLPTACAPPIGTIDAFSAARSLSRRLARASSATRSLIPSTSTTAASDMAGVLVVQRVAGAGGGVGAVRCDILHIVRLILHAGEPCPEMRKRVEVQACFVCEVCVAV